MFSVTCLGKNALYPTKDSATSGYLVKCNNYNILLDCGSGVFTALKEVMEPEKVDMIIISHFHFDHMGDLGVYNYYLQTKNVKIPVYLPIKNEIFDINSMPYFVFNDITDIENFCINEINFQFFKTNHPKFCLGTAINFENKKLVYSADTNKSSLLDNALNNADLCILDSCFTTENYRELGPHLCSALCAEYAKKHNVKTLLSHLPADKDNSDIERQAKSISELCELIELKEYKI